MIDIVLLHFYFFISEIFFFVAWTERPPSLKVNFHRFIHKLPTNACLEYEIWRSPDSGCRNSTFYSALWYL